jgi:streptogramin lyase
MRFSLILLSISLGLTACAIFLLGSVASAISVEETSLNEFGEAYDVNLGIDGYVYISDYGIGQVWQINPTNNSYTLFKGVSSVMNAQPDSNGRIWYTTWHDQFGYIDAQTSKRNYWQLGGDQSLAGLAIATPGEIWMSDFFGSASAIYHFDLATRIVCSYTITGGAPSYNILLDGQFVWIAEWFHDRLTRLDMNSGQVNWWEIGQTTTKPQGILLDINNQLWWADEGLGALANLDPLNNQMTQFNLPLGEKPRRITLQDHKIWYTEWHTSTIPGTVGVLDPQTAMGITTTLITDSETTSPSCTTLGNPISLSLSGVESGSLPWQPGSLTPIYSQNGWEIYQLPTGSNPYGITASLDHVWVADQGRQKITRIALASKSEVFIPLVIRP